jgi:hypothetical protein
VQVLKEIAVARFSVRGVWLRVVLAHCERELEN